MIKEYHTKTGKRIRLIHGDCMEWMKDCEKYDLAIVDPPYGINIVSQFKRTTESKSSMMKGMNGIKGGEWDHKAPDKDYFYTLINVSKNQIIWGGNYFIDHLHSTRCFLSWDKMNGTNNMADFELAWTSFDKSCRRFSMHHFSNGYDSKIHPTQKPVKLYRWLLQNYAQCKYCHGLGSYEEDVAGDGGSRMRLTCEECNGRGGANILDTHGGSMSHAIACWEEDFELDIIELDKDYYDSAVKRFEQHISQKTLF